MIGFFLATAFIAGPLMGSPSTLAQTPTPILTSLAVSQNATSMPVKPIISTASTASQTWNQFNTNYDVTIHLTEGSPSAKGMGWLHIEHQHGLTNSLVLRDIATYSNQSNANILGTDIWLGTTYYSYSHPNRHVTVFMVIRYINGQFDVITAYPLKEGKKENGITSYTNIALKMNGKETLFPLWLNKPSDWHRQGLVVQRQPATASPSGTTPPSQKALT